MSTNSTLSSNKVFNTFSYLLSYITTGAAAGMLSTTLNTLADNTESTLKQISILFVAKSFAEIIGSLFLGKFYDKVPGHRISVIALIIISIALFLIPLQKSLISLAGVLFILGLANGTVAVGSSTMIVWVHQEKVAPYMNLLHAFFGIGAFVAPLVITKAVVITGEIKWGYWLLAFFCIPALSLMLVNKSPKDTHSNTGGNDSEINYPPLIILCTLLFIVAGCEVGFANWIYNYIIKFELANLRTAGYMTSSFYAAFTIGRLVSAPLSLKFKPDFIILFGMIGGLLSCFLMLSQPHSLNVVRISIVILGFFVSFSAPPIFTLTRDFMKITGKVNGILFFGCASGVMSYPWVLGQLFESMGPMVIIYLVAGSLVAGICLFGILSKMKSQKELK